MNAASYPRSDVRAALIATFVVFGLNGFVFASWAARIPAAAERLNLSSGQIGGVLLFGALGSLIALPLSGALIARIGSAHAVRGGAFIAAVGAACIGVGLSLHSVVFVAVALFILGIGIAVWDVSMNIQGSDVERAIGVTVLPKFHAAFSAGAFCGALVGAGMAAAGIDLAVHLWLIVGFVGLAGLLVPRWFLPDAKAEDVSLDPLDPLDAELTPGSVIASTPASKPAGKFDAWKEPRTLAIGLLVLGAALTEGAANDWIAKATVDGLGTAEATGALMFAAFVLAMTVFRYAGAGLVDRFGRVAVLYTSFSVGLLGVLLFVFAPNVQLAVLGAVLWGAGAAMGFPLGISAAADEPRKAAARVAVVSTIGYSAFLAGPPLLGFVGELVGIRPAMLVVGVVVLFSLLAVPSARPTVPVSRTDPQRG